MKSIDKNEQLNNEPKNKWGKYVWLALFISAIYIFNRATEDYCFTKGRKLSDEEFILIALDKLIKSGKMKLNNLDNTPEKYLKQHPGCCWVYDKEHFSQGFRDVSVVYELNLYWKLFDKTEEYEYLGMYTVCGFEYDSTGSAYNR